MTVAYHTENNLDILRTMPDNSVDSVVTDPPYGLGKEPNIVEVMRAWCDTGHYDIKGKGFMGKEWDAFVPQPLFWKEVYRVLKPGGHMVVACGTRTQDWMAASIRFAGFEIRNCVAWVYASGFPKSLNISKSIDSMAGAEREVVGEGKWNNRKPNGSLSDTSVGLTTHSDFKETAPSTPEAKQWDGWGTDLKPAIELWTVARKPLFEPTVAANVLKWGTGGINIDGSRVETGDNLNGGRYGDNVLGQDGNSYGKGINKRSNNDYLQPSGRFPANLIHDNSPEVVAMFPETKSGKAELGTGTIERQHNGIYGSGKGGVISSCFADQGSASRFFKSCEFTEEDYPPIYYCAKASRSERNEGLDGANHHATVKPVTLMRYLCRLITPPGGTILDPFCGSGTTGVGAVKEGFSVILIDQEKEYMDITQARVNHAMKQALQENSQLSLSL